MELSFAHLFEVLNRYFTLYCIFPSIVLLGLYLTVKLRFVQITKIKLSFTSLFNKEEEQEGSISHFQAVASVLASNFGTGNISGMAVALTVGGPGALLWMWVMAFLGSAIQFASCYLGVKYRSQTDKGEFVGGPMYYLSRGLRQKKLAIAFCLFVIAAAFAVGGLVQVNSITLPLEKLGIAPWISGVTIAFFVALVVLGGAARIANVSAAVVPFMALLYLGGALFILGIYREQLPSALHLVFTSAFSGISAAGGVLGFTIMKAISTGFDRAIFATDAGTGTVPLLQSGAKTKSPIIDGVVSLVAPLLVMIVCTATALVLIVTGATAQPGLESTNMVTFAFSTVFGHTWGLIIVFIALILFGYTTTIAWASCLERAIHFLFGQKAVKWALFLYILSVPLGAFLKVGMVWIFADLALTAMVICNLIAVAGLSQEVIAEHRRFFGRHKEKVLE